MSNDHTILNRSSLSAENISRRTFVNTAAKAVGVGLLSPLVLSASNPLLNSSSDQQYKIAVCDWMILKRQKLGAFDLTKKIGADGVEVDMGGLGTRETFDNKL